MQLSIDGVCFGYSSVPVLNDITLEFDGPQFISILGPNGVGKSTLIHCINKILEPICGVVSLDGEDVSRLSIKDLAKSVGYVPYATNDTFPLTVVDTVLMGRYPHGNWRSLDKDLDIVHEILKALDIEELVMRQFNELSAGQHQKVILARGLVQEPNILLLDEPTSNLDIRHQIEVTKLLKNLSLNKNLMVIMISHDINIAAKYADKVILMSGGKIHSVGTPKEVITVENILDVYGVISDVIMDEGRPHVILKDSVPVKKCDDGNIITSVFKQVCQTITDL